MSSKCDSSGLLSITPSVLEIPIILQKGSSCSMRLTNNTDRIVAFKITANKSNEHLISASLVLGVLLPKATSDVLVWMRPRNDEQLPLGTNCMNKLKVRSVLVPKATTVRDATDLKILRWIQQSKEKSLRTINIVTSKSPSVEEHLPPMRSVFCLKNRKCIKEIEKVEDCFILEFDPFESFDFSSLSKSINQADEDATSIAVVAERGKVACRDYPHPRHLCVVHPFNKTAHKTHCKLCYCYVCDTPAPCKKWAQGGIGTMHCDATEDIELWRRRRRLVNLLTRIDVHIPLVLHYDSNAPIENSRE